MSNKPARKFNIGDPVIWTDFTNGMRHPGTVRAHIEPGPDDNYDPTTSGPLYDVQFKPDQHWQMQVAETDLSPSDGTEPPPPGDPFSPYDMEQITWKAGGTIVGALQRTHQDRLTIGAYEHPGLHSKCVTIRMYRDGQQTDALDLDINDADAIFSALRQAVHICWPAPPDPPAEPRTDWDNMEETDDPCPRCGWLPGDDLDQT